MQPPQLPIADPDLPSEISITEWKRLVQGRRHTPLAVSLILAPW